MHQEMLSSDPGDFRVTFSFAQMAAVLTQESFTSAEIMSNRIFGSLRLVGGIVELAGAGVLCAVPEPTLISKVGCVAMAVHAADQLSAASTQILTGRPSEPFAFKAGNNAARSLGASSGTAEVIGLATEFAVPLSTASLYNAFRVSSVRAGRVSVITSEKIPQVAKGTGGGHTFAKHVEKDLHYLQNRFASKKVNLATTFYDLKTAEWAVSHALQRNKLKILMYSKAKFLLKWNTHSFDVPMAKAVGWGVARQAPDTVVHMSKVRVVVSFVEYNHMPYFIVTAFPIP